MANINIELPEELHKRLKIACAMKGISIKDFVTAALSSDQENAKETAKRGGKYEN